MNTNSNLQQASRYLQRCLLVTFSTFLLTGLPGAFAQTSISATSTNTNSAALRANGKIAFTSTRDGNREIYVMNADGTNQVRLTNNAGVDDWPAWSPDGTRIAFSSQNASGGHAIKVMNADGTNQTEVTPIVRDAFGNDFLFSLSWSPDGARIAFQELNDIFTINVDGSNRINLTNTPPNTPSRNFEPSWSPDGSRIAFTSDRTDPVYHSLGIHTMKTDGTSIERFSGGESFSPDWSPDGTQIAFVFSGYDFGLGYGYVGSFSVDGLGQQFLEPNVGSNPKWSPDNTQLVFFHCENVCGIYVVNVNGSGLTKLTSAENFHPSWGSVPASPLACPNPIDCADFFVHQHYLDFLNREPDGSGWLFWANEISSCGGDPGCIEAKRINVSAAFFLSIEFQQTGYLVYRIYKASFGNLPGTPVPVRRSEFLPDTQQVGHGVIVNHTGWEQVLENNKQSFTSEFVQRSRFTTAFPTSITPAEFVDKLFSNADMTPLAAERADAINQFGSANTTTDAAARARALRLVAENSTLTQKEFNRAFVLMQYFGYLHRNPNDPPEPGMNFDGYNFWLNKLDQFNGDFIAAEMVKAFITSGEYKDRFGP